MPSVDIGNVRKAFGSVEVLDGDGHLRASEGAAWGAGPGRRARTRSFARPIHCPLLPTAVPVNASQMPTQRIGQKRQQHPPATLPIITFPALLPFLAIVMT
jgi:hypothetical protein